METADGVRPLRAVHLLDAGQDRGRDAERLADVAQRGDVLGQAAPAEADPGPEEVVADPRVERDPLDDLVDADADRLAQARDLVDERDPRRKERVGDVLDHLGRPQVGDDHLAPERVEQIGDLARIFRRPRPDDDPVRVEEVLDGPSLAQELRVGHDPRPLWRSSRAIARISSIVSPVPIGDVLLLAMIGVDPLRDAAIDRVAARMLRRFAAPAIV